MKSYYDLCQLENVSLGSPDKDWKLIIDESSAMSVGPDPVRDFQNFMALARSGINPFWSVVL